MVLGNGDYCFCDVLKAGWCIACIVRKGIQFILVTQSNIYIRLLIYNIHFATYCCYQYALGVHLLRIIINKMICLILFFKVIDFFIIVYNR